MSNVNTIDSAINASATIGEWTHAPKNVKAEFAGLATRVKKIMDRVEEYERGPRPAVAISKGNVKMGDVPSVSLPPVATCPNCKGCAKQCYYIRNCCIYPAVLDAVARNLALYRTSPATYFNSIIEYCSKNHGRMHRQLDAFRWHVGGDIPDAKYFEGMVTVAIACPGTTFLVFTKNYKVVNEYVENGWPAIPKNLQIIFSAWPKVEMDNPHNFPTSSPVFPDGACAETEGKVVHKCPGNCRKCFESGSGCWTLKHGEAVVFPAH